ncbi:HAD-IA family hydrolase [Candidatus Bipolaricaulota bacterium]|nr:HAD-IA family hydrolase [Candidatus Bipolaricaulota bacterium]
MIRGLIFDFDGLILDTEAPVFQSWQEVFARHDCELTLTNWADCIGRSPESFDPCDQLEEYVGRTLDRTAIRSKQRRREMELIERKSVLPGITDYITAAKRLGLRLGIASSSSRNWVLGHLSRLGLAAQFDVIRCAEDVVRTKPHPDLYLAVLDKLSLQPLEAVALEDSPHGVRAAKQAEIFCVVVPNSLTEELPLDHADLMLPSLAEVSLEELLFSIEEERRIRGA